ncbi:MAG: HAMP domain-containing histidine kinase [Verrucomicrobiae bacterium]|nr:HAMP domain-containing histidine kinase [Verrucomicrobiae bacterium]
MPTPPTLGWFLLNAADSSEALAKQRASEAATTSIEAARDRLLRSWHEYLTKVEASIEGKSPSAAFAQIVRTGTADAVIVRNETGQPSYPSFTVPYDHTIRIDSEATNHLASELRQAITDGNRGEAGSLALELGQAKHSPFLDYHGRVIALNAMWSFLQTAPDRDTEAVRDVARRLVDGLGDYDNSSLPASQRRFLMHQLTDAGFDVDSSVLIAEDLAASVLSSNRLAAPSRSDRSLWSPLPDIWATETGFPKRTLLFRESTLQSLLSALFPNHDVTTTDAPGHLPIGATMPGWHFRVTKRIDAPDNAVSQRALYLWVGVFASLAMGLITWLISKGLLRESKRARLEHDLASTVSHELRPPLSSIQVFVDLLLEEATLDEQKTREYLRLISQENARLTRLVDNFLTLSLREQNVDAPEPQTIEIASFLEETARLARNGIAGERLKLEIDEHLPQIEANPVSLRSAVMNLLDNAFRYSPPDSSVRLRGFRRDTEVYIDVIDHGPGLTQRERGRVFETFRRGPNGNRDHPSGCGLGLSIVKAAVEQANGKVEVHAQAGGGSLFRLRFPAILRGA